MRSQIKVLLEILIFIFIISISATASAKEITIDNDSGADFRSIQEAVSNSIPGDTIIVKPGSYTENVLVNTAGITIRSESKNSNVQIKPLNESESVFLIKANNVTISGFNITGDNNEIPDHRGGVCLKNAENCSITGNVFIKNRIGVFLDRASYNTISENLFFNDELHEEIYTIVGSDMNSLTGNTIENGYITLGAETSGNLIAENKISKGGGIHVSCCGRNNVVSGNTISNCSTGIYAYDQGVYILNNRITDCHYGIQLSSASAGIDGNTILNCDVGIDSGENCHFQIINNTIILSAECGIFDQYGDGNKLIYNNYFNNTLNVKLGVEGGNTWNNSLTQGTNIAGGPYIGGNFWAKPDGTGFSQVCVDLDKNGIGDLPYKIYEDPYGIYEDKFDYLPLVSLSSSQNSAILAANFTASATDGSAPLAIKFIDLSKNAFVWSWDFDGDGVSDSKKQNPVYAYKTSGNYTVNLTASNGINTSSKLVNITVGKRVSSTWPFLYITNGAFSVIDTATGIVITSVKAGSGPEGVAVAPDGKTAYVANRLDNNVSVIDTATNTVTATVDAGDDPSELAVTPDGKKVYVTNFYSNDVSVIDTASNTVIATVPVGSGPSGVAVTPDGKKVYVTNYGSFSIRSNTTVSVIDTDTNIVTATVPVGTWPCGVAVTPDGSKVYVANMYSRTVSVIDTVANTVIATVDVDYPLHEVVVNPAGTKVYVAGGDGFVSVIDTTTRKIVTTLNVEKYPEEIAITPDGEKVYLVTRGSYENNYSNTISVIDTSNDSVSSTVNIETSPAGIAIIPDPESVFPVANFSSNVSEGFAPLSVQFNGSSENATSLSWDFGDGATSTDQSPTHTYSTKGTYNVNLVVSNANGTSSKSAIITVHSQSSSSGSSSSRSGSGGSAGGSPEPQSNVGAKEISQTFVTSGSAVKFNFLQKTTPVLYLGFDSKKTTGRTITIVEMLREKSTLVTGLPSGEVYRYLNIWVGNGGFGDSDNIANAVINFKVEKTWIKDKSIDLSSITLNRYSDRQWNQLSTSPSEEDDTYLYFTAKTPGFSPFAITGKTTATGTTVQPATGNKTPSEVNDTQNNAGNTTANIDRAPERTQSSNTSGKEGAKMPDFEIVTGIICLLSMLMYKRR